MTPSAQKELGGVEEEIVFSCYSFENVCQRKELSSFEGTFEMCD